MITLKLKLYEDTSGALKADYLDGLNSISQHIRNTATVKVQTQHINFPENSVLRIAFTDTENENDVFTETLSYSIMSYDYRDKTYNALIPSDLLKQRGTWYLCLQLAYDYNEVTEQYDKTINTPLYPFTVTASLEDGGEVPSIGDIQGLYDTAKSAVIESTVQAGNAESSAQEAAQKVVEAQEIIDSIVVNPTESATAVMTKIKVKGTVYEVSGGGGGEPNEYIKNAIASGNTLTLYKKDGTPVVFTPTVEKFTNSDLGGIKGSTDSGKVKAESDGTGSVNGFDDKLDKTEAQNTYATITELDAVADDVDDLESGKLDKTEAESDYAKKDGTYDNMTVGNSTDALNIIKNNYKLSYDDIISIGTTYAAHAQLYTHTGFVQYTRTGIKKGLLTISFSTVTDPTPGINHFLCAQISNINSALGIHLKTPTILVISGTWCVSKTDNTMLHVSDSKGCACAVTTAGNIELGRFYTDAHAYGSLEWNTFGVGATVTMWNIAVEEE